LPWIRRVAWRCWYRSWQTALRRSAPPASRSCLHRSSAGGFLVVDPTPTRGLALLPLFFSVSLAASVSKRGTDRQDKDAPGTRRGPAPAAANSPGQSVGGRVRVRASGRAAAGGRRCATRSDKASGRRGVIRVVRQRLGEREDLCVRYHVRRLALFGSAASDDFDPEASGLDFAVAISNSTACRRICACFAARLRPRCASWMPGRHGGRGRVLRSRHPDREASAEGDSHASLLGLPSARISARASAGPSVRMSAQGRSSCSLSWVTRIPPLT